jgi:hypothetical protein
MKYESIYDISETALSIMSTCITEAAKGCGIEIYRHYADRVIVDAVIVAAFNNLNRSSLSRQYRAILAVTFGDQWKWFIRTWGPMFIRNHISLESVRWDDELKKEKTK